MNTVHLQGLGSVPGKPASELKIGDIAMFNYGYKYEVIEMHESGKASVATKMKSLDNGKVFDRRFKLNTIVAIS